jgi:hypothetical protein
LPGPSRRTDDRCAWGPDCISAGIKALAGSSGTSRPARTGRSTPRHRDRPIKSIQAASRPCPGLQA